MNQSPMLCLTDRKKNINYIRYPTFVCRIDLRCLASVEYLFAD